MITVESIIIICFTILLQVTKLLRVLSSFTAKSARQNRTYEEESKEESVKPNLDQKHGWQAKRSLDSELYRNVELEVWEDSKNGSVAYLSVANLKLAYWLPVKFCMDFKILVFIFKAISATRLVT